MMALVSLGESAASVWVEESKGSKARHIHSFFMAHPVWADGGATWVGVGLFRGELMARFHDIFSKLTAF
jgi:hypothetical protein